MLVSKLAKMRADKGLTVPLETLVAALRGAVGGPTKLARAPDPTTHDALLRAARDSRDPTSLGIFADHLDEHSMPGAALARAAMHYGIGARIAAWEEPGYRARRHYEAIYPNGVGEETTDADGNYDEDEDRFPSILEDGTTHGPVPVPHGHTVVSFRPHVLEKDGREHPVGVVEVIAAATHPHTGPHLSYEVPVTSLSDLHPLLSDLPEAQADRVFKQAVGYGVPGTSPHKHPVVGPRGAPNRMSRVTTYVGGRPLPGARRAIGVWDGGAEPSNVVQANSADEAEALAVQNAQKSAIWFEPGPGKDSLHVFTLPGTPADARKALNKHGVSYATLVPKNGGTEVHVVDQGGEFDGVLPGTPTKGTATFKQTGTPAAR